MFTDNAPLEPQINGMHCIGHMLMVLGNKLNDKLIAVALILSLPPSYNTLKMILTSVQSLDIDNIMTQIDNYSCKAAVDGIRHKSDILEHLKAFVTAAELESSRKLKVLRSDGGGKYVSCEVCQFLCDKGIRHETTTADSPEFNEDSGLPKSFWFDAVEYAMYIHNIILMCSLTTNVMPHEAWTGNKPDVLLIRTFGCHAFVHIPDSCHHKLDPKSLICMFIGYAKHCKAYRLVHRPMGCIIESRDVIFEETPNHEHLERVQIEVDPESDTSGGEEIAAPIAPESADSEAEVTELLDADEHPAISNTVPPAAPQLRCSTCNAYAPVTDDDARYRVTSYDKKTLPQPAGAPPAEEHVNSACADPNGDPLTYKEAMSRPDAAEWLAACNEELHSFKQMGVYEEVDRPRDCKVVNSKWVFRIKRGPNGEVEKYKARLVAKGFTQVEGIDFDETFTPVVKFTSLRMLLALATKEDLEVHQMDVKTAYLHGELEEEIYLQPPAGFGMPEGKVWKLIKSVYGLKQAGRVWYLCIKSEFEKLGYTRIDSDHSFFTKWAHEDGTILYAAIYVDDIILVSNLMDALLEAKEALKHLFNMSDLGKVHWVLRLEVIRNRNARTIVLSHVKTGFRGTVKPSKSPQGIKDQRAEDDIESKDSMRMAGYNGTG
ncbi:hypothetical protein EWM64_g851 [Hericium alpestre]|uniref:Uncharacterized protein n=1 Tax=Hericium alpestre TaxID=135208 RepID=A0A4Z0AA04_9AGAM|nr:hypothetical protein EWM64_g851 [Hericium alpestre]